MADLGYVGSGNKLYKNGSMTTSKKKKKESNVGSTVNNVVDSVSPAIKGVAFTVGNIALGGLPAMVKVGQVANDNKETIKSKAKDVKELVKNNPRDVVELAYNPIGLAGRKIGSKQGLKTAGNIATNMGEGAIKTGEGVLDTLNDIADRINNPLTYAGNKALYGKETADKALKESEKKQEEFIKRNLTKDFTKATGFEDMREQWEDGSLVKSGNLGGQVAQGVGGMVPSLLAGQYLGFNPELTNTANLSGKAKALASLGNVGKTYLSQLPANAILTGSSYGSGLEEALNEGATREQARRYGLANAAIEQGTEMMTGGIPGLQGKGGIDNYIEPLINKNTNGYLNALLKAGYGALGEGLEESTGTYLNALAKKGILGKDINWDEVNKEALQSGLVGAATGAILNAPANIQNIQDVRTEKQNKQIIDNLETIANQEIQKVQSAVQSGQMSYEQGMQEVQMINNIVNDEIKKLNPPQETVSKAQETVQDTQKEETRPITQETQNEAQEEVKEPIKEQQKENIGVHYGDLGKARDTYYSSISGSRGTGHLGTGTYFVSENYKPGETSTYAKRPVKKVSFDNYNLYKPSTDQDGYDLHDGLKAINSKSLFNKEQVSDIQKKYNTYLRDLSDNSVNELINTLEKQGYDLSDIKKDFEDGWSTRAETDLKDMAEDIIDDYDRLYKSYNKMIEQIKKNNPNITDEQINKAFEATNEALEEYNEKGYKYGQYPTPNVDSLSTVFMKNLGYEGVDVRHLKGLDDTTYGSVIYDLKNRNIDNSQQKEYNEGTSEATRDITYKDIKNNTVKATIAPYYNTPLTKENYNEIKSKVDTSFRKTAESITSLLGGKIKETSNNIGGFTFEEGENAGQAVKELSYTFELENMSREDAQLMTSLMGDLAHEQQEAVIAASYTPVSDANALEYRLTFKNLDNVMDALEKAGINDYTIDEDNNTLKLLEFDLDNPQDAAKKIADLYEILGDDVLNAEYSGIQSDYITKSDRERIYKTWLDSNEGSKQNRELRSLVEEAYEKVKVEEGTGDSSFSNEEIGALDKSGNIVMSPFLQNNGGGGNNNINDTNAIEKQPEPKPNSVEADILRSYDERISNKKKSIKEKTDEFIHESTRALFDKGEEIDRIGKNHNDAELYPLYDLAQTSKASADYSINAYQTNLQGERTGDSLNKVWEKVEQKDLVYEMNKYLYELHNIDRWNQFNEDGSRKYVFGEEHSDEVSKQNIKELLRLHPELEELSKPILKYQKNLKQLLVESGQLSQKQSDNLDEIYGNYVPTWRDKDNSGIKAISNYGGNITVNNQLKKATGSSEDLLPLKEVQAQMTENIFKSARMNVFLQQLYKNIGDLNELKKIGMSGVKSDTNIEPINAEEFYKSAEQHLDEYLRDFAPNNVKVEKVNGQPVATVWFNGQKVSMPIDKGIQTALEPVRVDGNVSAVLNTINNFKRGVITQYNPVFAVTNAIKDADDAAINSKFGAIEYKKEYLKTAKEMFSNEKMSKEDQTLFDQYLAMGGYSNTVFDKRTGFAKESKGAGKILDKIGDVNDFIEQIPRFTEFKLTLKHGGTLTEAMYNAAEVTTNFKRSGVLTKKMDKMATTFFSASMAGFYKQVRNLTQQPNGKAFAKFATKALALGLTPAIINGLMYSNPFGDDDDKDEAEKAYKNLPQYVKDNYLVWYTGDGKFMRIPKGRVASIPGIVYNAAKSKSQKEEITFGEIANSILNQVGPANPLSSNAILQIWQSGLFDNDSQGKSWSGGNIESYYLHKKAVTDRYDSKTDEISIALSKGLEKATNGKIKISPKKLSYTLDQNSGVIGDFVLPWFTPKSTGSSTLSRVINPITSKFSTDTVQSNKTSNNFYNKLNEYNQKEEQETATREDMVKASYLGSISGEISEKRKQIEEVESSNQSKNEKYKQTRQLQKEINELQEKGLKNTDTYKKEGKYASTIGDDVYYKSTYNGKTTWKKETEKTKEKRDELGLDIKKYYYYKKEEAFTRPDGTQTSLVNGDKAKEKIALVDAFDFDPSDYLEYEYNLGKIKEGKNTKNKVFEYINGLDISREQKIMLMKKKYKSYRKYDKQLFNTINNSDLTLEEKESLRDFLKIGK